MPGERMEREIEEQPGLLAELAAHYLQQSKEILGRVQVEMILLAARGSSDHAALYARYLIEIHLGLPVALAAPSVLTRYGTKISYPRCLAIGISQSGSAPDVSEVIGTMRSQGHATLAITNTPESRLAANAEHTLLLGVGKEESVAATKTYTASLLALYQLVRALGANMPNPDLPDLEWSSRCRHRAEEDAPAILTAQPLFSLGRGYSFATANEAALKLMECALIPCRAYSTADFQHGPKALAGKDSGIITFDEIGKELQNQGASVLQAPSPEVPEEIAPIWEIMYGQWLALTCARLRKLDPDKPQFIQKVTQTL